MVIWKILSDEEAQKNWNQIAFEFKEITPYQTYEWGQHKKNFGWIPIYYVCEENKVIVAMTLIFMKKISRLGLFWIPGGSLGNIAYLKYDFISEILKKFKISIYNIRISFLRNSNSNELSQLNINRWVIAKENLNSNQTMIYSTPDTNELALANLSGNWRHNLKRSEKYNLNTFHTDTPPNIDLVFNLYHNMETYKKIKQQYSREELISIFKNLRNNLKFFICEDNDGTLISFRALYIIKDNAWDFLAVTSEIGRKKYSSYATFGKVLSYLITKQIKKFDFSGISKNENKGVYNFKKGVGGEESEYLGEWDQGNFKPLTWLFNKKLSK